MGKALDGLDEELRAWIGAQRVFFVATAPHDGRHVNLSPKGGDTFRVIGPHDVAYLDLTGSGAETVAHLRENGRITVMFCAFEGPPRILRLYGRGEAHPAGTPRYVELEPLFGPRSGARAIITVQVHRVQTSCGYQVPRLDYVGERDQLDRWAQAKGPDGLAAYRAEHNAVSLDGLPAL